MVVAVGRGGLVARDAVAGVDALDEPEVGERLERAVDRRDPDRPPRLAQLVVNALGAEAAVLPAEEIDDGRPRAAPPVAGPTQLSQCMVAPRHLPRGYLLPRVRIVLIC